MLLLSWELAFWQFASDAPAAIVVSITTGATIIVTSLFVIAVKLSGAQNPANIVNFNRIQKLPESQTPFAPLRLRLSLFLNLSLLLVFASIGILMAGNATSYTYHPDFGPPLVYSPFPGLNWGVWALGSAGLLGGLWFFWARFSNRFGPQSFAFALRCEVLRFFSLATGLLVAFYFAMLIPPVFEHYLGLGAPGIFVALATCFTCCFIAATFRPSHRRKLSKIGSGSNQI